MVRVGNGFREVAAGLGFTIGLKPDGSIWTWGSGISGGESATEIGIGAMHKIAAGVALGTEGVEAHADKTPPIDISSKANGT